MMVGFHELPILGQEFVIIICVISIGVKEPKDVANTGHREFSVAANPTNTKKKPILRRR
jgi:hypothetical protein